MNKRTSLSLFGGGLAVPAGPPKAPERLCLWKPGKTYGDFGTIRWDAQAATQVFEAYKRRGNPVRIDVEHNTNPQLNPSYDANRPPEGAGYVWLKMVAGPKGQELWLDPIQWSDYGRQQIESGSRRCLSPEWVPDPKSDRLVELIAVSLVQSPGTYQMGLMASARAAACGAMKMDQAMLIAAIEAALTSDDPKAAIEALLAKVKEMSPAADVVEPVEEFSSADVPEEKKEMAQLIASMRAFVNGSKKASSSVAAKPGITLEAVRKEIQAVYREEGAKAQLIASAKASPAYTDALASALTSMSLPDVKRLVQALPKAAAATTEQTTQVASAQKVAQLPGANPAKENLTPAEELSIDLITKASMTRDQVINEAKTASSKPAEDGSATFSFLSQMTARQPQTPKAN